MTESLGDCPCSEPRVLQFSEQSVPLCSPSPREARSDGAGFREMPLWTRWGRVAAAEIAAEIGEVSKVDDANAVHISFVIASGHRTAAGEVTGKKCQVGQVNHLLFVIVHVASNTDTAWIICQHVSPKSLLHLIAASLGQADSGLV